MERLKIFGIDLRQILTITTDNGSNVLKMVRDIGEILEKTVQELSNMPNKSNINPLYTADQSNDKQDDDGEIERLLAEMNEITDDDALSELFDDVMLKENADLLTEISRHMESIIGPEVVWNITGVNCSAHTLQLAIKDAFKMLGKQHQNVISLCHNVAKTLRNKSKKHEYSEHGGSYKMPRLDVETRWGSTYLMVCHFLF